MLRIFLILIGALAMMSCSILIMNHSDGNVIYDFIEPSTRTAVAPTVIAEEAGTLQIGDEVNDTIH